MACINVLDNDTVGASTHTVVSVTPVNATITEGQQACWNITLNAPVAGSALAVSTSLSGSDQARHGYVAPSAFFDVGEQTAQVCVMTTDDSVFDGTETLCLTVNTGPRINAVPAASCINVQNNDADAYTIGVAAVNASVVEGQNAQWTLTLNHPATSAVTVNYTYSGTEYDAAPGSYPAGSVTFNPGETSKLVSIPTVNDTAIDSTTQLGLTVSAHPNITNTPVGPVYVTVNDNDSSAPVVGDLSNFAGANGMCYGGGTFSRITMSIILAQSGDSELVIAVASASPPPNERYTGVWANMPSEFEVQYEPSIAGSGSSVSLYGSPVNTWIDGAAGANWQISKTGEDYTCTDIGGTLSVRNKSTQEIVSQTIGPVTFCVNAECP